MTQTRRTFLASSAAAAGTITLLPFGAMAAAHASNSFDTPKGPIKVHPISHASFVMETPGGTLYVDPVDGAELYADLPGPDLILITHEHGDHYNEDTLNGIVQDETQILTNPGVYAKLSDGLKAKANEIGNGGSADFNTVKVDAIPAYNTSEGREKFHPKGRDNGYVLSFEGFRVYVSGDTEDIPEMRALENIDLAFVCMNLPFTMDVNAAASAVAEFAPKHVYPYHYRGRDNGTQDPAEFAELIGGDTKVLLAPWYG